MRIAMIGTGYVGLVSGACFADFGHQVTCVDKDGDKIEALRRGEIPIFEPGLDALVASNVKGQAAGFHHRPDRAGRGSRRGVHRGRHAVAARRWPCRPELTSTAAAREIAAALSGFTVVVTKSTVPVGTGDEVERLIREANPSADVVVASNPEFLREGAAIRDFKFPDRIVVGTSDERGAQGARRRLPAAVAQPGAADVHGAAHRRVDQIRRERVPRHQDHLHQRDRGSFRKGRRRRAGSRARHRARQPHRHEIPACRPGLWRLLLSRRTSARWSRSRSITTCSCGSSRRCSASTTTASARWRARFPTRRAAACAARPSPCSASPSSPIPTTCARRRRSRW